MPTSNFKVALSMACAYEFDHSRLRNMLPTVHLIFTNLSFSAINEASEHYNTSEDCKHYDNSNDELGREPQTWSITW